MRMHLKPLLLSTTLAAFALAPAVVVTTLATADVAWANNGKGNGGGNGNAGGNKDRGGKPEKSASKGGKPAWAGQGGKGNSQQARGGKDPVGNFLKKLTGQDKQEERAARLAARKAPTEFAPTESKSPGKRPARFSDMHPSDLGNMNGALNANINAVLAHVRNGNTNGPVGHMALLAVADANVARAEETILLDTQFKTLDAALADGGWSNLEAYLADLPEDPAEWTDEQKAVDAAILEIERETLLSGSEIELARPDEVDVLAAEDSLEGLKIEQLEAAAKVADYWNKNPDTSPNVIDPDLLAGETLPTEDDILSPEEQELIEDLRDRLTGYESEIANAIEEGEARALSGETEDEAAELPEGDEVCEAGEVCEEDQALLSE